MIEIFTNLELSKKLNELGVKQESLFWYTCFKDGTSEIHFQHDRKYIPPSYCSAFTFSELCEMLPCSIYGGSLAITRTNKWEICYGKDEEYWTHIEIEANQTNCIARMIIYLLENNLINVKDINK